jgi:hypothetical protein
MWLIKYYTEQDLSQEACLVGSDTNTPLTSLTVSFVLSLLSLPVQSFLSQQQYAKVLLDYLPPAEEVIAVSRHFFDNVGWM